ncbi:MAG: hypothetical protein B7Z06_08465 [Flavobacteriales bacterium 32-35-8]|nr:MAG: hypothetical protein B7Z06_08465 [Flavobacteriales bacterium 32-35-8]
MIKVHSLLLFLVFNIGFSHNYSIISHQKVNDIAFAAWILDLEQVNYTIASTTNPTGCNSEDGMITISGVSSGLSYTISYTKDSLLETIILNSTSLGEITLTGLDSGSYDDITVTEDVSGYSENLGQVVLSSMNFIATATSTNPNNCTDGTITISGLSGGLSYTINYIKDSLPETVVLSSTPSGDIILTGLGSGSYYGITITEETSGCIDNINPIMLSYSPYFTATVTSTNPTSCVSQDGIMLISGLSSGLSYSISYTKDLLQETEVLTSNSFGEIALTGLAPGSYDNIMVTEEVSGCTTDNLGFIELICFDENPRCFETKKFFTPNGDGYNDVWGLELLSNNCNYILYIFDRYGKLLETLTPQNDKWDGTYSGLNMPSNDYWYIVNYKDEEKTQQYTSHFTLKR